MKIKNQGLWFVRREGEANLIADRLNSKSAALRYLRANGLWSEYKRHEIRIGYHCETLTKVIFRKWPAKEDGDVIALFPAIAASVGKPWECSSYQHIGQHGAASVDIMRSTVAATQKESADLKAELQSIGYYLQEVRKFTPADEKERRKQLL